MTALPAWSQTTVTSNGREGQTACVGVAEVDAANMPITALSTSSVTVTVPEVTWSQVLARLGDGQAPVNAVVYAEVINARTRVRAGSLGLLGIISSTSPTYAGGPQALSGLAERSLYHVEIYASPAGKPVQYLARRCFMTGGTYTMTANPAAGQTSGCFSISPRTREDIQNCWCGRRNTLPLFGDSTDNTNFMDSLGCR
ncbi:MAG: hypothetical protein OXF73_01410 [Gammaproteobacteria bacterium]|nr:hypothetical protein [Gammaproteobacteria bacterium]